MITGLARSTVASHIDALMISGLVGPAGEAASSGGRPPARVAFNPAARLVLAVDVGTTEVLVAISDLAGKLLNESLLPLHASQGPETVLDGVLAEAGSLLAGISRSPGELIGVGIALPGPVEQATGHPMKSAALPAWEKFDVSAHVQRSLPVPVLVDSAVNLMAIGERTTHWPGHENLFYVNMASSIRSAIISSGQLQRGTNGSAGDLGHIPLARDADIPCTCGNYGCLDALASWPAVAEKLRAQGLDVSDRTAMADLVAAGNPQATQAIRQAGRDIGEVLATVVSLLNPSVIVVGGIFGDMGEQVVAGVREVIYKRCPPLTTSHLRVVTAATGSRGALHGASQMVIEHVLSPTAIQAVLAAVSTEATR